MGRGKVESRDPGVLEIVVKYRVVDVDAAVSALRSYGIEVCPPVTQDDQAYAPVGWDYGQSKIGVAFARLRTQGARHLFTVKRPVDNEQSCLEYECEVSDREQMHAVVLAMGYRPTVRIVKTRRTASADGWALCLDDVEHAGAFLEIERLPPPGDCGHPAQRELDAFVARLGVAVERVADTYDSFVRAAHGRMVAAGV